MASFTAGLDAARSSPAQVTFDPSQTEYFAKVGKATAFHTRWRDGGQGVKYHRNLLIAMGLWCFVLAAKCPFLMAVWRVGHRPRALAGGVANWQNQSTTPSLTRAACVYCLLLLTTTLKSTHFRIFKALTRPSHPWGSRTASFSVCACVKLAGAMQSINCNWHKWLWQVSGLCCDNRLIYGTHS